MTWLRAHHHVVYDGYPTPDGMGGVTHPSYTRLTGYDPTFRARVRPSGSWRWDDTFVPPVRLIEWALARDDW